MAATNPQRFHLSQFLRGGFEPARQALRDGLKRPAWLTKRLGYGEFLGHALAYGEFLQSATQLCVGAQSGYFQGGDVSLIIERCADLLSEPDGLPPDVARKITRLPQFELFRKGAWEEALNFRVIPDSDESLEESASTYQSSMLALRRFRSDRYLEAGIYMMLLSQEEWDSALKYAVERFQSIIALPPAQVRADLPGLEALWPLDATIRFVRLLDALGEWAADLGQFESTNPETWDEDDLPGKRLTRFGTFQAVAQTYRWRFELSDQNVIQRWKHVVSVVDATIEPFAEMVNARPVAKDEQFVNPWPEGFTKRARIAATMWDRLSHPARSHRETPRPLVARGA